MNMTEYSEFIKKAAEVLPKGAFLTVKDGEKVNTMTIGWGSFGFEWGMPVFEAMVRESRFTKGMLDNSGVFTVTFPTGSDAREALAYCGRMSGRDTDKIKDCQINLLDGRAVDTPVVDFHGICIECRTVMTLPMDKDRVSGEILDKWYQSGDLHTMYYGEVVACYEI